MQSRGVDHEGFEPPQSGFMPGLQGVRALAVLAVLVHHSDTGWAPGGFLGVDVFFVLSGFLITGLLLDERSRTGRVALRSFWARRIRRLMPAVLVLCVAVGAMSLVRAPSPTEERIGGDAAATVAWVANWRFVATGQDYFGQFEDPSPLQHTWSLAVEEQFYVLWPLVVGGIAVIAARRRLGLTGVVLALSVLGAVGSAAWMGYVHQRWGVTRAYYGTDTRAFALLIGAALAALVRRWPASVAWRDSAAGLAVALSALAVLAALLVRADGEAAWMYPAGFVFAALASAALLAAVSGTGPAARLASWGPAVAIGAISYGLYLWHWPAQLWVPREGVLSITAVRVSVVAACTVAGALASWTLVERPVRDQRWSLRRLTTASLASVVVLAGLFIATDVRGRTERAQAAEAIQQRLVQDAAVGGLDGSSIGESAPTTVIESGPDGSDLDLDVPPAAQHRRVLVIGDSVAWSIVDGFGELPEPLSQGITAVDATVWSCELGREDHHTYGTRRTAADACASWRQMWSDAIAQERPDVVVVHVGPWEVLDRYDPESGSRIGWGGAAADDRMLGLLDELLDVASDGGRLPVVLLTALPAEQDNGYQPSPEWTAEHGRWRFDHLNELLGQAAADHASVSVADLAGWVCPDPAPARCVNEYEGVTLRADGVHFTRGAGSIVAAAWLAQRVGEVPVDESEPAS